MPFITQGKTNIKYLLIVIILAAVVGGVILVYQYWWLPKEEIKLSEKKPLEEITKSNCGDIQDLIGKNRCYYDKAIKNKDDYYCGNIGTGEFKTHCYIDVSKFEHAIINKNPSMCWFFETPNAISTCWENFGMKDWKTYRNEQYNFGIKYPKELSINQNLTNGGGEFVYCISEQEDLNSLCRAVIGFNFPDNNLKIGLFILQEDKVIAKYGRSTNPNVWLDDIKNYLYELVYVEGNQSETNKEVFNQMLSTFSFLK